MRRETILGDQDALFKAMFRLRYQRAISDDEFFSALFKLHLERGTRLLKQDWELAGGRAEDFYARLAEHLPSLGAAGKELIDHRGIQKILRLEIGNVSDTNEPFYWMLNKANNAHAAVVGTTGSGKTHLVKEPPRSTGRINARPVALHFFDYARGNLAGDADFVKATHARIVELPREPAPVHPFPRCETQIEINQQAHHIARIFRDVAPHIGIVQEQRPIAAVQQWYRDSRGAPPDFFDLGSIVNASGELDSLTGVLGKLTDLNLFPSRLADQPLQAKQLLSRSWIIDLHKLQELREWVVFLILDSLKNYFSQLRDQSVDQTSGARELRCLIVIDAAHNFLPKDNAQALEKCLRELRGKGVGVWLLTQNPSDLEQEDYNYAAEVNFHVCLKVLDAKPAVLSNLYRVPPGEARNWSVRLATFEQEGLCRNSAIPKGLSKIGLKQFWQRKR